MGNEGGGARQGRGGGAAGSFDQVFRAPPNVNKTDGKFHKGTVAGLTGNSYFKYVNKSRVIVFNRGGGAGDWRKHNYTRAQGSTQWSQPSASIDTGVRSLVTAIEKFGK